MGISTFNYLVMRRDVWFENKSCLPRMGGTDIPISTKDIIQMQLEMVSDKNFRPIWYPSRTIVIHLTGADPGYVKGGAEIQKGGRVADITRK